MFFSVNDTWDIFKIFRCTDITPLPPKEWVILANGQCVKTFSGEITLLIKNQHVSFPARVVIGESAEIPLIGMKFLELLNGNISLDFKLQKYIFELNF